MAVYFEQLSRTRTNYSKTLLWTLGIQPWNLKKGEEKSIVIWLSVKTNGRWRHQTIGPPSRNASRPIIWFRTDQSHNDIAFPFHDFFSFLQKAPELFPSAVLQKCPRGRSSKIELKLSTFVTKMKLQKHCQSAPHALAYLSSQQNLEFGKFMGHFWLLLPSDARDKDLLLFTVQHLQRPGLIWWQLMLKKKVCVLTCALMVKMPLDNFLYQTYQLFWLAHLTRA